MIHLGELGSAYLDGETTEAESAKLVAHLSICDACQNEMADLHRARTLVRSLPVLELPNDLLVEFGMVQDVLPLRRRPLVWVGAAAAAAAMFVATATAVTPATVGVTLDDVSNQYGKQQLVEQGLSPTIGIVRAEGGQ